MSTCPPAPSRFEKNRWLPGRAGLGSASVSQKAGVLSPETTRSPARASTASAAKASATGTRIPLARIATSRPLTASLGRALGGEIGAGVRGFLARRADLALDLDESAGALILEGVQILADLRHLLASLPDRTIDAIDVP